MGVPRSKMKKFLRIIGIVLAVMVVMAAGLSIFVNSYFRGERLKALVLPRIERATGRKASIENISISIFRGGVVLSGLALARRSGGGNFLDAKELVLKYRFWPLLKRRLVIDSLYLDSPYVFIERRKDGTFNFSDIKKRLASAPGAEKKKTFLVAVRQVSIRNARARFVDETGALPPVRALADMDFELGAGLSGRPVVRGEIDLKAVRARIKTVQADINGRIRIARRIKIALDAFLDKDLIRVRGFVNNYPAAPAVTLDASSKRLDLEKLLSVLPHAKTKNGAAGRPAKVRPKAAPGLTATGRITVAAALYKKYVISGLSADYRYSGGAFSLSPFRAGITGGNKVIVNGLIRGGIGFGPGRLKDTLTGEGRASFSKIMVLQSPITRQIAILLGMPELGAPAFSDSLMDFSIRNGKTSLDGHFDSADLEFNPVRGSIGRRKDMDIALTLQLSPALSGRLGGRYLRFLANRRGWTAIPLKIGGTTSRPHVAISAAAGKALKKRLGGEIKKQLQRLFR